MGTALMSAVIGLTACGTSSATGTSPIPATAGNGGTIFIRDVAHV